MNASARARHLRRCVVCQRRGAVDPHCQRPFHSCPVVRRITSRPFLLDLASGDMRPNGAAVVRDQPCGAPLFSSDYQQQLHGVCRGCHSGWSDPGNYRLDVPVPLRLR